MLVHVMNQHKMLEKLEEKRQDLGLTKEEFAVKKLEVSHTTYYRWLTERFNPTLEIVERIRSVIDETEDGGDRSR